MPGREQEPIRGQLATAATTATTTAVATATLTTATTTGISGGRRTEITELLASLGFEGIFERHRLGSVGVCAGVAPGSAIARGTISVSITTAATTARNRAVGDLHGTGQAQ